MASVYKNALVTITIVDKVPLQDILKQPIASESTEPKPYHAPNRDHRDLDTRSWASQERHLSHPIVSITNNGSYWDCRCHSASHRMPIGIPREISPLSRNSEVTRRLLNPSLSQPF